jgi:hypothetical protein
MSNDVDGGRSERENQNKYGHRRLRNRAKDVFCRQRIDLARLTLTPVHSDATRETRASVAETHSQTAANETVSGVQLYYICIDDKGSCSSREDVRCI